jgi:hypothetical protein
VNWKFGSAQPLDNTVVRNFRSFLDELFLQLKGREAGEELNIADLRAAYGACFNRMLGFSHADFAVICRAVADLSLSATILWLFAGGENSEIHPRIALHDLKGVLLRVGKNISEEQHNMVRNDARALLRLIRKIGGVKSGTTDEMVLLEGAVNDTLKRLGAESDVDTGDYPEGVYLRAPRELVISLFQNMVANAVAETKAAQLPSPVFSYQFDPLQLTTTILLENGYREGARPKELSSGVGRSKPPIRQ